MLSRRKLLALSSGLALAGTGVSALGFDSFNTADRDGFIQTQTNQALRVTSVTTDVNDARATVTRVNDDNTAFNAAVELHNGDSTDIFVSLRNQSTATLKARMRTHSPAPVTVSAKIASDDDRQGDTNIIQTGNGRYAFHIPRQRALTLALRISVSDTISPKSSDITVSFKPLSSETKVQDSLLSNLIHHYPLNSVSDPGTVASDIVGDADGTIIGNITSVNGQVGQAASFNGDQQARIATGVDISLDSSVTFAAWANASAEPRNGSTHRGRRQVVSPDDRNFDWSILIDSNRWSLFTGPKTRVLNGSVVESGTPVHLVGVWNVASEQARLYINGSEDASGDLSTGQTANSIQIGNNPAFDEPFDGWIDDVRIYNRALSPSEISTLYTETR